MGRRVIPAHRPAAMPPAVVLRVLALVAGLLTMHHQAAAQEFSRYLACKGDLVLNDGKTAPAFADFALRFNSRRALIQRSNMLPVGEYLAYVPTQAAYSMVYKLPVNGVRVITATTWFSTSMLVLYPDLTRLNQIRIGIDRQTGELTGDILNENDARLASFRMACTSRALGDDGPAPKF